MSDDLDLSWIEEEQSLLEGPTTQSRKTIMSEINFHCIYIGLHQEIVSHVRNRCSLEMRDTHSILSNSRLLKYIKLCNSYSSYFIKEYIVKCHIELIIIFYKRMKQ